MSELLIVIGFALLAGSAVGCLIDRRRTASFKEYQRRYREFKAEVEREARKRL